MSHSGCRYSLSQIRPRRHDRDNPTIVNVAKVPFHAGQRRTGASLATRAKPSVAMNPLYHALLDARVAVVAPYRRARLDRMCEKGDAPVLVPFYHRVADSRPNDWTISTEQFQLHVDHCREHFDLIDLAEVQRRIRTSDSPRPAVSFTFDDGYAENSEFALPLLIENRVPCTYFVATAHIRQQHPFPHDTRAGIPLPVNTLGQLREASEAGIEIGLHTRNHVDFSLINDPLTVRREIVEAKDELEQMIGCPVRYFAFPYGLPQQLTPPAIDAVVEAGLLGFCSAFGGYNLVGRDEFHIRRFHGDRQFARLRNWLSFDSSKVWREPVVRYALSTGCAFPATPVTP